MLTFPSSSVSTRSFLWILSHFFILIGCSDASSIFKGGSLEWYTPFPVRIKTKSLNGYHIAKAPSFLSNGAIFSHGEEEECVGGMHRRISKVHRYRLLAKPILRMSPARRDRLPKGVALDYENILRSNSPLVINYNTRLTDMPGVDVYAIDDLYGGIYDSRVLMKQLRYFLERDDFHSITRLLKDNKGVLSKEVCSALMSDVDHLLFERLKYKYPTLSNLGYTVPFLAARYVIQHVMQQDLESRKCYQWLEPGEIPPEVPESSDYVEPKSTPENPIHVKDTAAYRSLMGYFNNLTPEVRLRSVRELYQRMIEAKRGKLRDGLWKYQRLKPFHKLTYRRKVRTKINIDRVCPFLSRPRRCTDEMVKEYTGHFEDAVNKEDLATACRLLKRYTRRIDLKNNFPLLYKFKSLFARVHSCRKYNEKALALLRGLYWSTVKRHKVLIKWNEPIIVKNAGRTMKDIYEEQLENYRRRRDAKNDERMKKMGVDMDKVRDFSNAYGEDWLPILYPQEYEEALARYRERLEKLRRKGEKVRLIQQERRRKRLMPDGEDEVDLPPKKQTPAEPVPSMATMDASKEPGEGASGAPLGEEPSASTEKTEHAP